MKKLIGLRHAGCGGWIGRGAVCRRCGKKWEDGIIESKDVEEVWVEVGDVKVMSYVKRLEYPDKTVFEIIVERRWPGGKTEIDIVKKYEVPKKILPKPVEEDSEVIEFRQKTVG